MEFMTINNEEFEVINTRGTVYPTVGQADIYQYYARPSEVKARIYETWRYWCYRTSERQHIADIDNFHVSSANTFQFSLEFNIEYNGIKYRAKITKDHNRLYPINA